MNVMRPTNTTTTSAPDLLTVEQAARVLQIGRTLAYELARRWLATEGADGMPALRVGRLIRVPRLRLEEWIGGPITWPIPGERVVASPAQITAIVNRSRSRAPRRRSNSRSAQPVPAAAVLGAHAMPTTRPLVRHFPKFDRQVPAGGRCAVGWW